MTVQTTFVIALVLDCNLNVKNDDLWCNDIFQMCLERYGLHIWDMAQCSSNCVIKYMTHTNKGINKGANGLFCQYRLQRHLWDN